MMSDFEILASLIKEKTVDCGVLVADLHPADFYLPYGWPFPVLTDMAFHITVLSGELDITVDDKKYHCTAEDNNLVDIKPFNKVSSIRPGNGFSGMMLALSRPFIESVMKGRKPIRAREILAMKANTAVTLTEADIQRIAEHFRVVRENCTDGSDARLDQAIFCYAALLLHLNIIRIVSSKFKDEAALQGASGNAARILEQFFVLLDEYVSSEHEVAFYAAKLAITPHYLSMISNRFTGCSASRLIADSLMSRAYDYLRNRDYTIQEIAERLHFSDQSSFGKFFRKHSSTTPAAYRRNVL